MALLASTLLLAGCFTVEATFTIGDDATAEIDYLILIDTEQLGEFADLLGEDVGELGDLSGDDLLDELLGGDDPCGDLTAELTEYDVSTREIDENGQVGIGCTVSGVPVAELQSLGDDTSSFSIEQDADGTRFDATLEGVDELAGDPAETGAFTDLLGIELDELFTIRFVVSAPGSLGDNNASSTSGSTATWEVTPDADFVVDGDAAMSAVWTPGGGDGGSPLGIILAIVGALIIAAVVAVLLVRRAKSSGVDDSPNDNQSDDPDNATEGTSTAPTSPPPPPPPPPPPTTSDEAPTLSPSSPPPPPPPPPPSAPPPPPPPPPPPAS